MNSKLGFTLIEIMITVAIIGILAILAIPAYNNYISISSEEACLMELKAYANHTFLTLNDLDPTTNPSPPNASACESITDASIWTENTPVKILTGRTSFTGARKSQCNLNISPSCFLIP
jgi:type IV pilus assembly protein PilA